MELLFVCSRNKRRSLTAERIFNGRDGIHANSAGTETGARVKLTPGMLSRADIIFCMEKKHLRRIRENYSDIVADKRVVCLNIPDDFEYMDDELIDLLESVVGGYLE
ncbi:MAG: protein tyrosine phosphatase [Oscillospiraceae bacterium]|nr:protein tyrosine phosphatase [Oscillospiraceae bacterium]